MDINITEIIEKYQNDMKYIKGQTEYDIFESFYSKIDKTYINNWVNKTFTITTIKNDKQSEQYRNIGNNHFKKGQLHMALENYNKSINFAIHESENYFLGLGNRSAVFFEQNKFINSVKDIKVCLNDKYPESSKCKLYLRLINCYKQLKDLENAKSSLELFKKYLEKNPEMYESKKDQLGTLDHEISQLKTTEIKIDNENCSLPNFEKNQNFLSASNKISLKFHPEKGRHVISTENIKTGDVLFVEKPFSFVPIFGYESKYCYHCFTVTENLYPCKNCSTQFCSFECLGTAWTDYHRFECTGSCVGLWPMVGVNFLANRMLVLGANSGYKNVFDANQKNVTFSNKYEHICSLVTNIDKMGVADVFPHVVSSIVITTYLREKTDYFDYLSEILDKIDTIVAKNKDSLFVLIGSVLLKHSLQLIANATSIENVETDFYKNINSLKDVNDSGVYIWGVGIYPSVSMMNHSCCPNIANYFINDYIVIRAKTDIPKGSEVFNSYGYDSTVQSTDLRQQKLKTQYYFECKCKSCTFPTVPEIFKDSFRCLKCEDMCLKVRTNYECINCQFNFDPTKYNKFLEQAEKLENKYLESNKDINLFKKVYELRSKILYKYNLLLYATNLNIQSEYLDIGDLENWLFHTKNIVELDKKILGENTTKTSLNIRNNLVTLLRLIVHLTYEQTFNKKTLLELLNWPPIMLENMKKMFYLHYDSNKINFTAIKNEIIKSKNRIELILSQN